MLAVIAAACASACTPWQKIDGPMAGGGFVWDEDRGFTPQATVGYSYETYDAWYGHGFDGQLTVEPWRRRVSVTPLVRGRFIFWSAAIGPTASWSPEGASFGLVIDLGAMIALGRGSDCLNHSGPSCIGPDDTFYPVYLPRLTYRGIFATDDQTRMQVGADMLLSRYWLTHGEQRPPDLN
jgi:hypothetical protein